VHGECNKLFEKYEKSMQQNVERRTKIRRTKKVQGKTHKYIFVEN
jgi:hypothetical protein